MAIVDSPINTRKGMQRVMGLLPVFVGQSVDAAIRILLLQEVHGGGSKASLGESCQARHDGF
jgi:hypothetical protein